MGLITLKIMYCETAPLDNGPIFLICTYELPFVVPGTHNATLQEAEDGLI